MQHGFEAKHELPNVTKGDKVPARIANISIVSAAPRQRQREADVIMEALIREYLNSATLGNQVFAGKSDRH
jgi:hypothetical protein